MASRPKIRYGKVNISQLRLENTSRKLSANWYGEIKLVSFSRFDEYVEK